MILIVLVSPLEVNIRKRLGVKPIITAFSGLCFEYPAYATAFLVFIATAAGTRIITSNLFRLNVCLFYHLSIGFFMPQQIAESYVQQTEVFWTVSKDWFFSSFLSHKALKYRSTYQNMEIVNKSKDGYLLIGKSVAVEEGSLQALKTEFYSLSLNYPLITRRIE